MSNINNPAMVPLFNPARSLIVQFDAYGNITVGTIIGTLITTGPDQGKYDYPPKASWLKPTIDGANATVLFEFGVVPGRAAVQQSGLLVERDDDWDHPWDEEVDRVIGGSAYPSGVAPLPSAGNSRMAVLPRTTLRGVFSGPILDDGDKPADNPGAQFVVLGVCRSSTSNILERTPVKYMSLWVPEGAVGTFTVTRVDADGSVKIYKPFTTTKAFKLYKAGKLKKFPKFKLRRKRR